MEQSQLLTIAQVLDRLQISRSKLYHDRKAGKIRASKMGRAVRFEETEVQKYIERTKEEHQ